MLTEALPGQYEQRPSRKSSFGQRQSKLSSFKKRTQDSRPAGAEPGLIPDGSRNDCRGSTRGFCVW